ncbi:tetratricopeptide repeat protein [Asanoa ferruginea]|uniref:Tetratricopeptide repeat protein n=1 Tax=Asanoa ferruginea TaxID=53367 RepID=A0A3D9ZJY1_9ACTN|nr:tetratricopeptide repeat protein [Asanoa ferruginea]REF97511.1 tetratricopeptide repeat protein [Asanoa ferruginea]GIF48202.1 tetratricopeptide repeat protein [Asanoa ferruginea]
MTAEPARANDIASPQPEVDARHGQGIQVNPGGGNTQNNYYGTAPTGTDITWPIRVGAIPPLASAFQHRSGPREQIDTARHHGDSIVLTQVLSGGGGVGKSQLAAWYADQALRDGVDLVVWVTATQADTLIAALAAAAARVHAPGTTGEPEADARALLDWLATTDRTWLIVFDDITHPRDVSAWWPASPKHTGWVLATTRRRDAALSGSGRTLIDIDVYTPNESTTYLRQRLTEARHAHLLDHTTNALADRLGHLPLALSHAAAYMVNQGVTCARYLELFDAAGTPLDELMTDDADGYHQRVSRTLLLGLRAADTEQPQGMATKVVRLAALLDPAGHPEALWTTAPVLAYLGQSDELATAGQARTAVRIAHRYALITHDPTAEPRAVRIHALTARAARESGAIPQHLGIDSTSAVALAAAHGLFWTWPTVERRREVGEVLRANAAALDAHRSMIESAEGRRLLIRAGQSLREAGLVAAAVDYWQHLLDRARHAMGSDHPDTLVVRHNMGLSRGAAGDPTGAIAELGTLVEDRLRVLGRHHPDTLEARNALANWQGEAGHVGDALAAMRSLLADYDRLLGLKHRNTLRARNDLCHWQGMSGDPLGAATALEILVADYGQDPDSDGPEALAARNNLAHWRGEAGNAAAAVTTLEGLVADYLSLFGREHPQTLTIRANLARRRGEAGDPSGAVTAFIELAAQRLRLLGPDHPETLITRDNLAYWQGVAGDAATAASSFAELRADYLRVFGPDHPETLASRRNLAFWRGAAGDSDNALADFESLLVDQLRVLGPDHPETLTTRHNIAFGRAAAGQRSTAVAALKDVLKDRMRLLGADHPDTLANRHAIAWWVGRTGDAAQAVSDFDDLLADRVRVHGPDHPYTLTTRHARAYWRAEAGYPTRAELEELHADRIRVLGANHPDTITTRHEIDSSQYDAINRPRIRR